MALEESLQKVQIPGGGIKIGINLNVLAFANDVILITKQVGDLTKTQLTNFSTGVP